ncbi:MAG: hypothetical protein II185_02615, partial [Firmicutes bacterium]|nr:hypothetical protein [Bacillota bacterium]
MTENKNDSNDYYPGEQVLFTIRGSANKRVITAAIFALFILVIIAGILVFKSLFVSLIGAAALSLAFWPLSDAYERIEVTNIRIKRSDFAKKTSKAEDIMLDQLASCRETKDGSGIELLFLIDDLKTIQSIGCQRFNKADENAMMLTQLPC